MTQKSNLVYLGISKSKRGNFDKEIEAISNCLKRYGLELRVFVDLYSFDRDQEKEMMDNAFDEIEESLFLIAEVSKKAIGVGVEVGYAKARNKPIIYIKRKEASYSTTVGGTADAKIAYLNAAQLEAELQPVIESMLTSLV